MAYYADSAVYGPPLSVKEIGEKAIDFEYNDQVALKYWLRTADTLLKEVYSLPSVCGDSVSREDKEG